MSTAKPTCFIIMPITTPRELQVQYGGDADHFRHVLEHLFIPAVEKAGYQAIPPIATGSDIIHGEIIHNLELASLVLCDMSTLNPNVFFELGIRTALDKPAAMVKDQFTVNVPFDTVPMNHHPYDWSLAPWLLGQEVEKLSQHVKLVEARSTKRNPMWKYFGLTTHAETPAASSTDEKFTTILAVLDRLREEAKSRPVGIVGPQMTDQNLEQSFFRRVFEVFGAKFVSGQIVGDVAVINLRSHHTLKELTELVPITQSLGIQFELNYPQKQAKLPSKKEGRPGGNNDRS